MSRRPWEILSSAPARALPPIDLAAPAKIETATLALG
jgi:hypothetical protein